MFTVIYNYNNKECGMSFDSYQDAIDYQEQIEKDFELKTELIY